MEKNRSCEIWPGSFFAKSHEIPTNVVSIPLYQKKEYTADKVDCVAGVSWRRERAEN